MTQPGDYIELHSLKLTYGLRNGEPDLGLHYGPDTSPRDLVTTLGMLRMAEDTIIRDAMGEIEDADD